jgi:octaprenyl-diphosphate synthase
MTVGNPALSETEYFEVATAKTAPLFEAAAQVAAIVAERPTTEQQALATYGQKLGITFQLVDDILDYTASDTEIGKNIGDDFREGKITLPVVIAYQKGSEIERAFWNRTLADLQQKEGDLAQAMHYLKNQQAFELTHIRAREMADQACKALAIFPHTPARQNLLQLVEFALERLY